MEGGWRTKGKILRRQEIMEAALELFSQKGFHGTTIAEVAKRAGVGVGTIYQHFKSKEELYLSSLEERRQELLETLQALAQEEAPTRETLSKMLRAQTAFVEKHRSFFKLYLSEQLATLEAVRERLGAKADHLYGQFFCLYQAVVERGIERGELKPLPPSHLTRAFMGILNSFLFEWLKGRIKDLGEVQDIALAIFMEGASL